MSFNLNTIIFCCLLLVSHALTNTHINECSNDHITKITNSSVTICHSSRSKCCATNDKNEGYTTAGDYAKRFTPSSKFCLSYRIKVEKFTFVGLFSQNNSPIRSNPWVEFVVGGPPDGTRNFIRKNGADIGSTLNQKQNSLNAGEYRGFWVSWVGGNYRIGYRGQPPFMTWQDPNPFPIVSVGVETCCGTIGKVVVEEPRCPGINI